MSYLLAPHTGNEPRGDVTGDCGAAVHHAGPHLHQRGAAGNAVPRLIGIHDAAHADDHQIPTGATGGNAGGLISTGAKWGPRHAALLCRRRVGGVREPLPRDGGVGKHHAGQPQFSSKVNGILNLCIRQVGSQLDQKGHGGASVAGTHRGILVAKGTEDRREVIAVLQLAKPGGIGRRHVDHHQIRHATE